MEQTGLETLFSYESYAFDKLRFAGKYGNTVGVLFGFSYSKFTTANARSTSNTGFEIQY